MISHQDGIETAGIGYLVALGAMAALEHLPPVERILKSLLIVSRFQPNGVLPPFDVEEL